MNQLDFVGNLPPARPFKDIRNTRSSVAEEKARLSLQLGDLIKKIPPHLMAGGSINAVREWRAACERCKKVAGSTRSSTHELSAAIAAMRKYWPESEVA